MANSKTQPPIEMLLQMQRVHRYTQGQQLESKRKSEKARLDYVEEMGTDESVNKTTDIIRRRECLKALETIFYSIPTFPFEHKPHKDLIVTYAMMMATHGGFGDDYTDLKERISALNKLREIRTKQMSQSHFGTELCPTCKSDDLVVIQNEGTQVCRSCGTHVQEVVLTGPEKFDYEGREGRTHHGDKLSPFLTAHGQTQGTPLEGEFSLAQKRINTLYGQNHNVVSFSTMDSHINRASDHLKNCLPRPIYCLYESNEAMYNTALFLFATKRKRTHSLHNTEKWLAAAVVLSIIIHLEVRKASSLNRNKRMRNLIEESRKRKKHSTLK